MPVWLVAGLAQAKASPATEHAEARPTAGDLAQENERLTREIKDRKTEFVHLAREKSATEGTAPNRLRRIRLLPARSPRGTAELPRRRAWM